MTITIKLTTDNAAFADDPQAEVTRIVRDWFLRWQTDGSIYRGSYLRDSNGNTVGAVKVTGRLRPISGE